MSKERFILFNAVANTFSPFNDGAFHYGLTHFGHFYFYSCDWEKFVFNSV
jgi:hypothetical protein